jgi:hypothetical protein
VFRRSIVFSAIFLLAVPAQLSKAQTRAPGNHQHWGMRPRGSLFPLPVGPFPFPSPAVTAAYFNVSPLWGSLRTAFPTFPFRTFFNNGSAWFNSGSAWSQPLGYGAPFYTDSAGYGNGFDSDISARQDVLPPPSPAAHVTIVFPPPASVTPPQPMPILSSPLATRAVESAAPVAASPTRERTEPSEYPALIVVKQGNFYSATKYWWRGKLLHFITSNGDHHQVPRDRLERFLLPPQAPRSQP